MFLMTRMPHMSIVAQAGHRDDMILLPSCEESKETLHRSISQRAGVEASSVAAMLLLVLTCPLHR
jgi:hypothetical protein